MPVLLGARCWWTCSLTELKQVVNLNLVYGRRNCNGGRRASPLLFTALSWNRCARCLLVDLLK